MFAPRSGVERSEVVSFSLVLLVFSRRHAWFSHLQVRQTAVTEIQICSHLEEALFLDSDPGLAFVRPRNESWLHNRA